jgi:hypothetical protein
LHDSPQGVRATVNVDRVAMLVERLLRRWVHAEQTEDTAGPRTHSGDHRPREVADDSLFSVEQ